MIPSWTIKPCKKGDTINSKKITFPFDITDCIITMQFKVSANAKTVFEWSTVNNTFEKISSTEIIMKSRILDVVPFTYLSDLQVKFNNGEVQTYLNAYLTITNEYTV